MTNNVAALTNVTNYSGNSQIYTINGNNLPITTIGDICSSLTNICRVEFSKSGCLVQDQH